MVVPAPLPTRHSVGSGPDRRAAAPEGGSGDPLAALGDAEQQLGQLGAEGIAGALQLAQIGGGGGERGVVEGVLDVLDRRPHLAEQPGVAVAQRVDRAPRRELGLGGRLGDQPGDVAGAERLVAEAAGEDGAVRPGGDLAAVRVGPVLGSVSPAAR